MAPQSQALSIHYGFNFTNLGKYLSTGQNQERSGLVIYGHYKSYWTPEAF